MSVSLNFTPFIPVEAEAHIQKQLDLISHEHNVRFLFAVESGSRAWGFPSPDSDFDVRFVYAHEQSWYLNLFPGRDVIELPIKGDWDTNGWDIRKALQLLLKPNPVLLEWLSSPIRYRWKDDVCTALIDFVEKFISPTDCAPHYFHLARRQWLNAIEGKDRVNLKKYFYTLRPVLALRWLRLYPDRLPPMNFQELVNGTNISNDFIIETEALLDAKSRTSEIGSGKRISSLDSLISSELTLADEELPKRQAPNQETIAEASQLFRSIIGNEI